jgi:hypothetical protein
VTPPVPPAFDSVPPARFRIRVAPLPISRSVFAGFAACREISA